MFERILVVCVGNICRSPIAEVMLRHYLPTATVASAGLHAMVGKPMAAAARAELQARGLHAGDHLARQLDVGMLHAADLVLVMERAQVHVITDQAPELLGRTFVLDKWQGGRDIADPYGQQRIVFAHTCERIDAAVKAWLPYLREPDPRGATRDRASTRH